MTLLWQVTWNSKLYDYEKLINDFKNNNHSGIIYQCKGRAKMVKLPKINDYVYISCNKLKIMKCKVISNFVIGHEEKYDLYNIGSQTQRIHSINNEYLTLQIEIIYENPEILKGFQRTWCKYK